jgi:hypothetical protein
MSDSKIRYASKIARAQWRALFLKCELTNPVHKAAGKWLAAACDELMPIAHVQVKPGGIVQADPYNGDDKFDDLVSLEISRDALLGIKFAVINVLKGGPNQPPANHLERMDLLNAVAGIGPDGILRRMVEADAKLPDGDVSEDKEMGDLLPKKDQASKDSDLK